jgi:hypothetical protein
MSEVFLQHPESITTIIPLHSADGKGITQSMRADSMYPASFRVEQGR